MLELLTESLGSILEHCGISAELVALVLLAVVFVFVLLVRSFLKRIKSLKSRIDEMQPRENRIRLQEDLSLQQKRMLDFKERELQEKEELLRERESNIALEIDRRRRILKAENKAWRDDLVKRYHEQLNLIEEEFTQKLHEETCKIGASYAQQHVSSKSLASLRSSIPYGYASLFSDPLTPELSSRILSALSGDISIVGETTLSACVQGSSGNVYHTTLAGCECEDFRRRGQPCKHMLLLILSFSALGDPVTLNAFKEAEELRHKYELLEGRYHKLEKRSSEVVSKLKKEKAVLLDQAKQQQEEFQLLASSNKAAIPWLAGMMADYLTRDLEQKARSLDWGSDVKRQKKVESIREIRAQAQAQIQEAKVAIYQLEYLKQLYPGIEDVLDTEYSELNLSPEIPEHDPTRDYLSKDEWAKLPDVEKDQLALDRYINSQNKTKWQIGRDYELSVSYECMQHGFSVDTFGSRMGLEDLGRDIIATSPTQTLIIQCKYWSKYKTIHEKHLFQLYGTLVMYRIDHPDTLHQITGVFVTNTALSDTARAVAEALDIIVIENHSMVEFPRIKCNIGKDEYGSTRIYHLPMDMQYDVVQIKDPGEFYAFTIQEALDAGFRRAYKWHGSHAEVMVQSSKYIIKADPHESEQ